MIQLLDSLHNFLITTELISRFVLLPVQGAILNFGPARICAGTSPRYEQARIPSRGGIANSSRRKWWRSIKNSNTWLCRVSRANFTCPGMLRAQQDCTLKHDRALAVLRQSYFHCRNWCPASLREITTRQPVAHIAYIEQSYRMESVTYSTFVFSRLISGTCRRYTRCIGHSSINNC